MKPMYKILSGFFGTIALTGLACGSVLPTKPTATPLPSPTAVPPTEVPPTPIPTEPPVPTSAAVRSLDGVKDAVVQIVPKGTYIDPAEGLQANSNWAGSGFIISPDGLAVTNNHVVAGAALIDVYVGGSSKRLSARLVARSECADLAVIDIAGGDYPFVEWYTGPVKVGLAVYAAGFPLGDPEYTLTSGIVSKEKAAGDSDWASVDSVLEHDARINPGNSGGPLVTKDGQVVGVNYAVNTNTDQNFAIGQKVALPILDQLLAGDNVETIGINGTAVQSEDGSLSGVWVGAVESGSVADKTGIKPGDIILTMEGLSLATDGTMADYCDILRGKQDNEPIAVEVLRYDTQEVLAGQLNGRALTVSSSLADQVEDDTTVSDGGQTYTDYTKVTDDTEAIQMVVPIEWSDVSGDLWKSDDDIIGAAIVAAPNIDDYNKYWDVAGVFFGASNDLAKLGGYVQLLDITRDWYSDDCQLDGRYDYNDGVYRGRYDLWTQCDDTDGLHLVLSAVPIENPTSYLILVDIQAVTDADFDALDRILKSFKVVGDLP
jgi:serine protease Do